MRTVSGWIAVMVAFLAVTLSVCAEPVTVLLEKGIYTEETAGDVDGAIRIYEQILSNEAASRAAVAEANYRLGNCRLKKGDKIKAQEAFQAVVSHFADQQAVAAKAKQKLAQLSAELLALQPAPWKDGEVMRLNLKTAAGAEIGTMIWTADADNTQGGPAWRIEQRLFVTANNSEQFTRVVAKKDTFAPIQGVTVNQMGRFEAAYGDRKVDLKMSAGAGSSVSQVATDGPVYDNEQALYLVRRLPLAEGYKAFFPIFPVTGGSVVECRIEVVGKEKLAVPAGAFECFKVDLSVWSQNIKALQHQLWLSADANRYLVRYDSGQALMDLTGMTQAQHGRPSEFADRELGISLTLPPGWFAYRNPSPGGYMFSLQLLPPQLKSWAAATAVQRTPDVLSTRFVAEHDIAILKGFFKNYTVRPDSWKGPATGDLEPVSFAADYDDQNKAMVEYRTYILGRSTVYWFVFRVEKALFESEKPAFDAIVASLKVAPGRTDAKGAATSLPGTDELKKALVDMQVRKERLDQIEKMTEADLAQAVPFIVAEPILAEIRRELNAAEVELKSALAAGADKTVEELTAAKDELTRQLHQALEGVKNGLRADYEVARRKYEALRAGTGHPSDAAAFDVPTNLPPAPLSLDAAPWTDGEIMHYNRRLQSGALGGAEKLMVKADRVDGKDVWRIEQLDVNKGDGYRQYARILADGESMIPVASHYDQGALGTFDVRYETGKILVTGTSNKVPVNRGIAPKWPVYDANEVYHIVRRMPLAQGYTRKFSTYYVRDDRNGYPWLEVTGVEKVTVPAGTFECFRVEFSPPGWGSHYTLWISTEDRRCLVKVSHFRSEDAMLELASITHEPERQFFKDGKPDFGYVEAAYAEQMQREARAEH